MANVQQCQIERNTQHTELITGSITGNTIPNEFYQIIVGSRGTPDLPAITIFSEIVYWYRPDKNGFAKFKSDAWQTSHSHFKEKFGYYDEKTRRAFIRLEELELIKREHRTVTHYGQKYSNRLFIHLTNKAFSLLKEGDRENILPQFVGPSPQIVGEYIKETKNIVNNRSMSLVSNESKSGSNFSYLEKSSFSSYSSFEEDGASTKYSNSFGDAPVQNFRVDFTERTRGNEYAVVQKHENSSALELKPSSDNPRSLESFLPLSESDCKFLQKYSGREFNQNAMNEILQSIAKKLPDRTFHSKKGFFAYASKALAGEKRQAELINNSEFRIQKNLTEDESEYKKQDAFLQKLENSRDVSKLTLLKKKIAGSFETKRAYQIIQSLRSVDRVGDECIITFSNSHKLNLDLDLSDFETEVITDKAKEIFYQDRTVTSDSIKINFICIGKGKDQDKEKDHDKAQSKAKDQVKDKDTDKEKTSKVFLQKNQLSESVPQTTKLPNNIWGEVRGTLIDKYGEGTDKSWFSRLETNIDEGNRTIELKTSTEFIRCWIEREYGTSIRHLVQNCGFELKTISAY